jgi:hypothetical protein
MIAGGACINSYLIGAVTNSTLPAFMAGISLDAHFDCGFAHAQTIGSFGPPGPDVSPPVSKLRLVESQFQMR